MLKIGRLHSRLSSYKARKQKALALVQEMIELCPDAYVSCSFGKDSAVLLHLAMQVNPHIEARFLKWDESDLLHDYPRVEKEWQDLGANIKILHISRKSLDERVASRWQQLADIRQASGNFVGMRASESKVRRITLRKDGVIYKRKNGTYRLCPIAWWSDNDIAAYTYEHNLPILDAYLKDGVTARTTSRIPRNDWQIRSEVLNKIKIERPEDFRKLAEIYGEVNEYV